MKTPLIAKSLCASVLLAASLFSHAAPVTWQLSNLTFTDGGTATGSFVYDAAFNSFSNIAITTSTNGAFGANYAIPTGIGSATFFDTVVAFPLDGQFRLLFDLVAPMTDAGGVIALNLGAGISDVEGQCISDTCGAISAFRIIATGSVASIPEPATLALVGLALLGVASTRRRT